MNKILNRIFETTTDKIRKPKRTKETILGVRQDGFVITIESALPEDRDEAVQNLFDTYPSVILVNVHPLRGRTKIIRRTF